MREINIAQVITAKRKEKGITQDTLAEYIGVSKASVSKWETAQSYPDITLLPQLASYFNISIDELIGYIPQMTKEDINKTYHHLATEFSCKPFDEVLDECRSVIKKYYACFPLLLRMAILLLNHYMLEKEKEKQEALLQEIADLCARITKESADVWIVKQANSLEALCRISMNQPLEALELLDESMKPPISDNFLLAQAYQMTGNIEKAKSALQVSLYQHLRGLLGPAQSYLLLIADQPEKFEQAFERFIQVSKIFEVEKLDPNLMCLLYLTAAQGYTMQNNLDNALKMLENYSYICTTSLLPYKLKGDTFFDSIENWLKDYDIEAPRDEKTIKESIVQSVAENPVFLPLQGEPKFKRIVDKLKENLGGNTNG
ncbi:helix-turn-helix domain-containing protein [Ectobacillus polymachus]|uniref:helix-turn-helix domain-containing protein n=1 Tax=Ectobacillus polymachus TaxID=1508806 RepID=UPI003A8C2521